MATGPVLLGGVMGTLWLRNAPFCAFQCHTRNHCSTFCAKWRDFGQLPQMYGARRELFFWPQPLSFWEVVRVCPKSISSIHGWSPKSATNELRHGLFGNDLKSWLSRVRPVGTLLEHVTAAWYLGTSSYRARTSKRYLRYLRYL